MIDIGGMNGKIYRLLTYKTTAILHLMEFLREMLIFVTAKLA